MPRWLRALFGPEPANPEDVRNVLKRIEDLEDALAGLSDRFNRLQKTRIAGGGSEDLLRALVMAQGAAKHPRDPFGEM